jgi:hypothetical protein
LVIHLFLVDRKVAQMSTDIIEFRQVKLLATYLEVCRRKHTDVEWFPTVDEHPLSDVELALRNTKRPLDVLLHNILLELLVVSYYLSKLPRAEDTETPRVVRRLDDPNVVHAVNLAVLLQFSLQLFAKPNHFDLLVRFDLPHA